MGIVGSLGCSKGTLRGIKCMIPRQVHEPGGQNLHKVLYSQTRSNIPLAHQRTWKSHATGSKIQGDIKLPTQQAESSFLLHNVTTEKLIENENKAVVVSCSIPWNNLQNSKSDENIPNELFLIHLKKETSKDTVHIYWQLY